MKKSVNIIFILLYSILSACNYSNNTSNTNKNLSIEKTVNIEKNVGKRIFDPNINSEKSTNLWIDLYTYTKSYIENDTHSFIDMIIPRFILHTNVDSTMFKTIDEYFNNSDDYDYISIKSALEENVFVTTENASIIAFATQIIEYGYINSNGSSRSIIKIENIIAESIDNGTTWKFADIDHLKFEGIENFYSKKECELIDTHLAQDMNNITLIINELIYKKPKKTSLHSTDITST